MFAALLTLLPALRLPTLLAIQNAGHERFAIDSCVNAVQIYFPCDSQVQSTTHACLCEQYLWRVTCFDEHATTASSLLDRETTESDANRYCRAAGSFSANVIQRERNIYGRQIGNIISSIAGQVTSILASNDVTVPTAIITSAINGVIQTLEPSAASTADVTAIASSIEAAASSLATASPTRSSSSTQSSTTANAEPIVTSSGSSKPNIGLIVGAVVGGVAALALIGILIMLILRHKKRRSTPPTPTDKEASPQPSFSEPKHSPTLVNESPPVPNTNTASFPGSTLAASTVARAGTAGHNPQTFAPHTLHQQPQNQHHNPHTEEKIAFHMQPQHPHENEMPTTANVWEIDGREMQHPQELESPSVAHAHQASPWERRVGGSSVEEREGGMGSSGGWPLGGGARERESSREEEYFGSPISPVSPIEPRRF
ncbi:hypothetical protein NX059_004117 [Plenodomus lindquistii]|nr:hypothetical protein NX059_004117 [Plenodomus lindquistii]